MSAKITINDTDSLQPEADETSAKRTVDLIDEPDTSSIKASRDLETAAEAESEPASVPMPMSRWKRLLAWVKAHKVRASLLITAIILLILAAVVVFTDLRFTVMNWFGSAELSVKVLDERTSQPVNGAKVSYAGVSVSTNSSGIAQLKAVDYGRDQIRVEKLAYAITMQDFTVGISPVSTEVKINPTGTRLSLLIQDKISGQPIPKAEVSFGDSSALSDSQGLASLSIQPQKTAKIEVTVTADGYGDAKTSIKVDPTSKQTVDLVPAGYIYFLSKQTGKVSVMKSRLDGSDRQTVLSGTGKESETDTVLLASRDWKYLALSSSREGSQRMYLIDTTKGDALTAIDTTNANYTPVGWQGSTFVYTIERKDNAYNQTKHFAMRSYAAESGTRNTIDETDATADGAGYQYFTPVSVVSNAVVYGRYWVGTVTDKQQDIVSVSASGAGKKVLKSYPSDTADSFGIRGYGNDEVIFAIYSGATPTGYVEYENGTLKPITLTEQEFTTKFYPTFLVSPTGQRTYWYEPRDGKNVLMIGDKAGDNGKTILTESDVVAYGWYTDKYILLAKKGSELYAMPADVVHEALKITDYHKPAFSSTGYGYGYGGF